MSPCGSGTFGYVEATTQFVDWAYSDAEVPSDGTQSRPWKRIQDGINNAPSGAIVAVAAGTYVENLVIDSKPVRLRGTCPALVEVVGTGTAIATLQIRSDKASYSQVRSLAITGPGTGIHVSGSSNVVIDRVWIRDTTAGGLDVNATYGPSSVTVRDSLIEATSNFGIHLEGSQATVERTVVRGTQSSTGTALGAGIQVQDDALMLKRSMLTLRTSVLEENQDAGISVVGSDAVIEATVVRASQPRSDGTGGEGIVIQANPNTGEPATFTLRTSLLAENHRFGVLILNSEATVENTVVRDTHTRLDGLLGRGINVEGVSSTLKLDTSLVDKNHEVGVAVFGAKATIEATVVRNTLPREDGVGGDGVAVIFGDDENTTTITSANIGANGRAGIASFGATVLLLSSAVRCNRFDINGEPSVLGQPFTFDGSKGNICACGESPVSYCKAWNAGPSLPEPLP